MTYKFELFLVIQKKKTNKYKNHSKIMFFYDLFILDFSFFYTKLTHLTQN